MVDSRQEVDSNSSIALSTTVNHCQPKVDSHNVCPLSTTVNHQVDRSTAVDREGRSTGSTGSTGSKSRRCSRPSHEMEAAWVLLWKSTHIQVQCVWLVVSI